MLLSNRMEREKLFQYFAGLLDTNSIEDIKSWAEQSEENANILLRERKIYDAITLLPSGQKAASHQSARRKHRWSFSRIAAVLTLVLVSGGIWHFLSSRDFARSKTTNETITVPAGQRVHIRLSDGTSVWLNAATTLTYSPDFSGKTREVFLDGQAYFDVQKDDRPFIVHTFALDIKVLGTQFDVCAYSKRGVFEATLMSGSISAYPRSNPDQHATLKPNQRIYLQNGTYKTTRIDDPDFYRWKEGIYCFREKKFSALLEDLERYYDCVFFYEPTPALEKETITGKLRISDGIDQALSVLQHSLHFSYLKEKDSNHIYITAKP